MTDHLILTAKETLQSITTSLDSEAEVIFLSAFFTQGAFDHLDQLGVPCHLKLAIRGRPMDFKMGSSDIPAVKNALEAGWDVRFISALHAKVYLIGDQLFIGSGNLTVKGMHLLGTGNLELNCLIRADQTSRELIRSIFAQAQKFDAGMLMHMEQHLENITGTDAISSGWWPENIVPSVSRMLFCCDFPQLSLEEQETDNLAPWTEVRAMLSKESLNNAAEILKDAKAIVWLLDILEGRQDGVRFGELTARLHNDLAEDPTPYRRKVKRLLANLLSYIQSCPGLGIEVSRPSHTQVVRRITY